MGEGEGEGEGVEGGGACGGARIMHGGTGGGGGHGEGGDHKGDRTEGCSERDDVSDGCCSALAAGSREDTTMLLIIFHGILYSKCMRMCNITNMNVVSNARSITCIIIGAMYLHFRQFANSSLCNRRH